MAAGNLRILTGSFRAVLKMCYEKVHEGERLRDIDIIDTNGNKSFSNG
jgi:hypothetical protein